MISQYFFLSDVAIHAVDMFPSIPFPVTCPATFNKIIIIISLKCEIVLFLDKVSVTFSALNPLSSIKSLVPSPNPIQALEGFPKVNTSGEGNYLATKGAKSLKTFTVTWSRKC